MTLSLIWAMTDQRVIGINNTLPWKLPADMRWFRQHTLGKPIVMGRKTFESFGGKPLPDRPNIVITQDPEFQANAHVAGSVDEAITLASSLSVENSAEAEIMIIGGASLYAQTLAMADRLYLTLVHTQCDGDAWFPEFDLTQWREVERVEHPADEKNPHDCSFLILEPKSE